MSESLQESARASSGDRRVAELSGTRSRFFMTMAVLLLAIAVVGFAPSFYLKIFFSTPALPWYLTVHGAVVTAWFALLVAQTALIATDRTAVHRRLGVFTVITGIVLILVTFYVVLNAAASFKERDLTPRPSIELIVLFDLGILVVFSILLWVGISFRNRPAVHKRAMLLASIAIVIPAFGRIPRWAVFAGGLGPILGPIVGFLPLLLLSAMWIHDVSTDKRVHATTAWGSALVFGCLLAARVLARTEVGKVFVAAISPGGG
jgi:hypothetical protein